jgi:hypothetical protein
MQPIFKTEPMTRTHKETAHIVCLTISEINKKLDRLKTVAQKKAMITEVCEKNNINEIHVRTIGRYGK